MFDDVRATQTRPRFYVPSERHGTTLMSNTQYPHQHCRGSHPGPLTWETSTLPTEGDGYYEEKVHFLSLKPGVRSFFGAEMGAGDLSDMKCVLTGFSKAGGVRLRFSS